MESNFFGTEHGPVIAPGQSKASKALVEGVGVTLFLYFVGVLSRVEEGSLATGINDLDPTNWPATLVIALCTVWAVMVGVLAAMEVGVIRSRAQEEAYASDPEEQPWP